MRKIIAEALAVAAKDWRFEHAGELTGSFYADADTALAALISAPLSARVAFAERLVPWEPIEDVEKTRSPLLLYGIDDSGAGPYVDVGHWSESLDAWILDRLDGWENEIIMRATHARPLPAPPTPAEGG